MAHLGDLEVSNKETEPKNGIYSKNLSKIVPTENFHPWSKSTKKVNNQTRSKSVVRVVKGIVINTVSDPVSVCPVEWNILVPADFGIPL